MTFDIFSELQYQVYSPTTFIFSIQAARSGSQVINEESLVTEPTLTPEEIPGAGGSRFIRLKVNGNSKFTIRYQAKVDIDYNIIHQRKLSQAVPINKLDADVMPYIFPSRYCQSDKLQKLASKEFGNIETAYGKVAAITEWIYNNVSDGSKRYSTQ